MRSELPAGGIQPYRPSRSGPGGATPATRTRPRRPPTISTYVVGRRCAGGSGCPRPYIGCAATVVHSGAARRPSPQNSRSFKWRIASRSSSANIVDMWLNPSYREELPVLRGSTRRWISHPGNDHVPALLVRPIVRDNVVGEGLREFILGRRDVDAFEELGSV